MSARVEAAPSSAPPKPPHVRRRAALHHRLSRPPPSFGQARTVQTIRAHETKVVAVAWSPSGQYLATAEQRGTIKMFYVLREKGGSVRASPIRTFNEHSGDVLHMAFSRTDFLVTASMDRSMRLWHADTNLCLRRFVHPDMVTAAAFHPIDENFVVSGGCDGIVRVWKPRDHSCVAQVDVGGVVTAMQFGHDGKKVFVGTFDGQVVVLDMDAMLENENESQKKGNAPTRSSSQSTDGSGRASPIHSNELDDREGTSPRALSPVELKQSQTLPYRSTIDMRHQRRAKRRSAGSRVSGLVLDTSHNEIVATGSDSRIQTMQDSNAADVTSRLRAVSTRRQEATAVKLCTSLSPDGRFLLLDAVGPYVRVMDLQHARGDGVKSKKKEKEVFVVFESVYAEGANVSCACFATRKAVEIAIPDRNGYLIAVGGDDGGVRIVHSEVE